MSSGKRFNRRRGAVKASDLPVPPPSDVAPPSSAGAVAAVALAAKASPAKPKDDSPSPKTNDTKKVQDPSNQLLTRPGQSIVDALKETTGAVVDKLDKHFAGWTPNKELAVQTHQKQKLDQDRKDKGLNVDQKASHGAPGILVAKPGNDQVQADLLKEEELLKQIEKVGEPGSIFWSPAIMKSHISDMMQQLHTSEMEELLGEQIEMLRAVVTKNSGLAKWLNVHDKDSKDHHEDVKSMVEGLEQRVEKSGRKTETTLYGCQDMGERMVALINAAFAERERVRQLLLSDADIVVTEEKKALLEERRRIGQEMSNKVRSMKQQEDELGYGGISEPPEIAALRLKIEKKTKKQNKLKAEQEAVQYRLKSLEQALEAVERGDREDKLHALDQAALENIEEAKGMARQSAIAPLLEQMKRERGLESPEPIEMPETMLAEKQYLEQTLEEVEREIEAIETLRTDWEGQRTAARKTVQYIEDEAEKRLSLFSAKRRRSYLGPMQVEPPVLAPMPPFMVEKAPNIKAGLRQRCREMQQEMEPLLNLLPKYLVLVRNAENSAKVICEQREKFIRHIRSMKPKFLKDLRSGGLKKLGNQDINAKLEEEQMMKEVETAWDVEEAKLIEGHAALQHRAGFFGVIAAELQEEFNKLEEAVQKNRWAFEDKMQSLEAVNEEAEEEQEQEHKDDEDVKLNLPEDEAEPAYVEEFLALEEDESLFVRKAIAAYRTHDEQVLSAFIEEGIEAEKSAIKERKKELEDKKIMREVYISQLRERRNSMAKAFSPRDSNAGTEDSGSPSTSRAASRAGSRAGSKDTSAEESPSGKGAGSGFLDSSFEGKNKLASPRNAAKRGQTMPRLSFAMSRPGSPSNNQGEAVTPLVGVDHQASSRPSSPASSGRSTPDGGHAHEAPVLKTTSEPPLAGLTSLTSSSPAPSAPPSPNARVTSKKGTLAMDRTSSSKKKTTKGVAKKRPARRAHTVASKTQMDLSEQENGGEDMDTPRADTKEDGAASESDVDLQGSDHLQDFLKLDRKSTRLEAKVRESAERLSKMRFKLVGENASPLDLDRLKCLAGDERARALAQDSVTELREKWTEMLGRRASVEESTLKEERSSKQDRHIEEDAFQETYAKLMAEIGEPPGDLEDNPPDADLVNLP